MTLDRDLEPSSGHRDRGQRCAWTLHDGPRPQHRLRLEGALSTAAVFCTNK